MKKYGFAYSYFRVFLYYCLTFAAANIFIYLMKIISGRGTIMSASTIIICSLLVSFLICDRYSFTKKTIRIDDKKFAFERVKEVMSKMKWKLELDSENIIVYKSRYLLWFWQDKIQFHITDVDINISGPNEYVERVIRLSQFPYAAFDTTGTEA